MTMSAAGTQTPAQVVASVQAAIKANVVTSFPGLVVQLTTVGVGLAGEEAENFGTLVTNIVQDVEGGMSWSDAWTKESATFEATAKSEFWAAALQALNDITTWFDGLLSAFEAAL
jgi:hypothetical protein